MTMITKVIVHIQLLFDDILMQYSKSAILIHLVIQIYMMFHLNGFVSKKIANMRNRQSHKRILSKQMNEGIWDRRLYYKWGWWAGWWALVGLTLTINGRWRSVHQHQLPPVCPACLLAPVVQLVQTPASVVVPPKLVTPVALLLGCKTDQDSQWDKNCCSISDVEW